MAFDNNYFVAVDPDIFKYGPIEDKPQKIGVNIPYNLGDPFDFDSYLGQENLKRRITLHINAMKPGDQLKMLLSASAGTGKTAFARIVAREMASRDLIKNYFEIVAGKIESKGQLDRFIAVIPEQSLIFIDEIHGLQGTARDALLPAIQDNVYAFDMKGHTMMPLPKGISWFGATTDVGKVHPALQRRLTVITLEPFSWKDRVILALTRPMVMTEQAAVLMANRCWTPWEIKDEVYIVARNIAIENGKEYIEKDFVEEAFALLGIDEFGLRPLERQVLSALSNNKKIIRGVERYGMSASALIGMVGMDKPTFYNKIEPKLLSLGLTTISPGIGREITEKGLKIVTNKRNTGTSSHTRNQGGNRG